MIVTGSRIRRVDTETPSPVQMVDRADIERTGRQNISEVLRGLISADNQGSIPTAFSAGFASGSSAVSLRGLGVNSTLVLLNGRRMATYGLADDGSRTFVDLNVIPLEAVERVEVLKDGGSALYGSDAVAGVVNIITRERYEGFSVGGSYGATEFNDGDAHRIHGSAGFSGDNYNVFVVAEQSSDDAISQANRSGYLGTSNLTQFGFFDNRRGAPAAGLGNFDVGQPAYSATTPFGVLRIPGSADLYDRVDVLPCNEISGQTGRCVYDIVGFTQIQPKQERVNILTRGTLDITPALQAFTELGFFTSKVEAVGTPGGVNDNGVFDAANPDSPITHSAVLPANHPDNPFGVARSRFGLLTTMLGGRNGKQESELVRVVAGLKGDITADWNWEAGVAYIENTLEDTNYGFIHFPTFQSALNAGTFRFDPALNSPELLRAISPELKRTAESSVELADASVSGLLFNLPGGRLGIAAGAEFRTEKNDTPPVPFTDTGDIVGLGFSAFNAERDVYAAYLEVDAPVHSMVDSERSGSLRPLLRLRQLHDAEAGREVQAVLAARPARDLCGSVPRAGAGRERQQRHVRLHQHRHSDDRQSEPGAGRSRELHVRRGLRALAEHEHFARLLPDPARERDRAGRSGSGHRRPADHRRAGEFAASRCGARIDAVL